MRVLISIQQPVPQWQIPAENVAALVARFPRIEFRHAVNDAERASGLAWCGVAYTWMLTPSELDHAPGLRWLHTSAAAVETLCLPELAARHVTVTNTRGVQSVPIAEHVLAVILSFAKQLPFVLENQRVARWAQAEFVGSRLPWLLRGRTLGLIGVGTIGLEIARRADALGMRVAAVRRRPEHGPVECVDTVFAQGQLAQLLAQTDVLVVAAPLTPDTHALIGAAELAQMKAGSYLINVGRARIVDTDALVAALRSGHLGGASLDVFPHEPLPSDHPLWTCPNVILTPHTSGFRAGHWDDVVEVFADNLRRYERGESLRFRVSSELGY